MATEKNPAPAPTPGGPKRANEDAGRELGGQHGANTPANTKPTGKPEPVPTGSAAQSATKGATPRPGVEGTVGNTGSPGPEGQNVSGKVAGLAMDKEQTRQIVLQASGFLKIFGGAFPRLRALAALLDVEARADVWDLIWGAFSQNPQAVAALADAFHHGEADHKGLGTQSDDAAKFLASLTDRTAGKSEQYYKTRAGIAGILMIAQGFAYMTRTTTDDDYVRLLMQFFTEKFDEFWAVQHPGE